MKKEDKEFIENLTKTEYCDYLIEKEIHKKSKEVVSKFKVVITSIISIIIAMNAFFGFKVNSISKNANKLSTKFDSILVEKESIIDSMIDSKRNSISILNNNFENSKQNYDRFKQNYDNLGEIINMQIKGFDSNLDLNNSKLINLSKELKTFQSEKQSEYNQLLDTLKKTIEKSEDNLKDWEEKKKEIIRLSSCITVYVERANDTESEKGKSNREYKPSYASLPFSDQSLRITFNQYKKLEKKVEGKLIKYKQIVINITLINSVGKEIYSRSEFMIEKQHLKLFNETPLKIRGTKHIMQAEFIYLPPNPVVTIPDFVILSISLDPTEI